MKKKEIAIFGGGPSALIAAYFLSNKCSVTIYEKEKSIAQKFLVAGKGGFNLTNSLTGIDLVKNYTPSESLKDAILNFDSIALRKWFDIIGVSTFVGTSGRVFSVKDLRPVDVLNKIKKNLVLQNVQILTKHKFIFFNEKNIPIVKNESSKKLIKADFYIFAFGGSSWSITGSDGKWTKPFNNIGINTLPFQASNCGVNIVWSNNIKNSHTGKPLKNIQISCGNSESKGEVVITKYGLEGNAIYSLIPNIRETLNEKEECLISIDLKPNNTIEQLLRRLKKKSSSKDYKKLLNLNSIELALLKSSTSKNEYLTPTLFIDKVKNLEIPIVSLRPIEEAISTIGGIDINDLNNDFSLKKFPHIFTIGEMVNWDAPTGGFLLHGCFSMGYYSAMSILNKTTN